jgi:hypothetical protein
MDQGKNRLKLVSFDKTIKEINSVLNINHTKITSGNFKFLLPVIFILLFVCVHLFQKFYRREQAKATIK